ncbi:hypothetical protein KUTeg_005536 [Tegillarca granosa]|uniref:Uncharacterized protein n=1 Tax=Tegillarca granosa TaxID=220873 RepID=A0ABQ9FJY5_TEGGR|nr:hypothetical protein KUTeg_005536 [Tegillarca granosa]
MRRGTDRGQDDSTRIKDSPHQPVSRMDFIFLFAIFVLIVFISFVYAAICKGWCHSKADLTGKTAIVTGANTGIGYCTARDLARRNARVILACRSLERGRAAAANIREETGNENETYEEIVFMGLLNAFFLKKKTTTPEEGAQTSIYCAVDEAVEGVSGEYFIDCKSAEHGIWINKSAYDEGLCKKLWEKLDIISSPNKN